MEPTEQEKRDAIRKALMDKYQTASTDTSLVDDAQERASNVGMISGIGQALEGIARSGAAPYGDKGPDAASYQNMRNQAQRGVQDAQVQQDSRQKSALQSIDMNRGMEGDQRGDRNEVRDIEKQTFDRAQAVKKEIQSRKDREDDIAFRNKQFNLQESNTNTDNAFKREELGVRERELGAARQAKEATKLDGLTVPGVGVANTIDDAKNLKAATEAKAIFDKRLNDMIALREKYGAETLNREAVASGKALSNDLLLAYKDMAKLGVLSDKDTSILNAIIPSDPLEFNASGLIGQDPTMTKLQQLKENTEADYAKRLSTRLRPGQTQAPAPDAEKAAKQARLQELLNKAGQ